MSSGRIGQLAEVKRMHGDDLATASMPSGRIGRWQSDPHLTIVIAPPNAIRFANGAAIGHYLGFVGDIACMSNKGGANAQQRADAAAVKGKRSSTYRSPLTGDTIAARFRYTPGTAIFDYPTSVDLFSQPEACLRAWVRQLGDMQQKLYAEHRTSLLIVFQGMDGAGKDSTIKHVTSGVNPQGFQVFNFKQPTYKENDHNYLWRYWRAMPERGRIGIFNRSYYEEVLVVRVHPDILQARRLPQTEFDDRFWRNRYQDIRSLERHLNENGTKVVKFFLHLSKQEQKARLHRRLNNPEKYWKFDPRDIDERTYWDDYLHAYQETVTATHTDDAPWYLVPADHKPTMRAIIASIFSTELAALKPKYPQPTAEQLAQINSARERLAAEP